VERLRAKGRWMNEDLSERDKDIDKQERRKRIKESSTWGERMQKKGKRWRNLDVGTRRQKTGRKERKEGKECAMRRERQLSTCGMDVAK
jgi:hypothetical protein